MSAVRLHDVATLVRYLAERVTSEDAEQPALDLGRVDAPRWTSTVATRDGSRLVRGLETACSDLGLTPPRSLSSCLMKWGTPFLHESLLEGIGCDLVAQPLPLEELWTTLAAAKPRVESHEDLGGGYVSVGRAPARGITVSAGRWDDPVLVACVQLGSSDEPLWLVYLPRTTDFVVPPLLPLALDFEELLLLHLTGVSVLLFEREGKFESALESFRAAPAEVRPALVAALCAVERAAERTVERFDVWTPEAMDRPRAAFVATLRELRSASALVADPTCHEWLDVPFVAVTASDASWVGTKVRALVSARQAPSILVDSLQGTLATTIGKLATAFPPVFVNDAIGPIATRLRNAGIVVVRPNASGDLVPPSCSLADGAIHVLQRVERMRSVLAESG